MTPSDDRGEWSEYRRLVMSRLDQISHRLDELETRLDELERSRTVASVRWSIAIFLAATLASTGLAVAIQGMG